MKTKRVLIIGGDPGESERHSGVLAEAGYSVLRAADPVEAAGIIRKNRGKIAILSDLAVNGEGMVSFMKETLKGYPFLPFLFLVSSTSVESIVDAMKAGACGCLRKPAAKDVLCRSVERSMERMSQMMESAKLEKEFRKRLLRSQEEAGNARALSSFKGFMISMAAHDFRTILTVLDGYLQCVREKCRDCSVASEGGMLKRASRTVGRLLSMTNTLLDFEAAETGRIRLEIKPFPLHETLRECVSFYEQYAEQKHVDLALCLESTEVMAIGDRERVMEILDNLLYNALKFTPANGKITLSGKKERGFALITVRDSGTGIPEEKLRNIFNPGVMIETLDAHTRFGLGMIICKKLAESQNGKIQVNSILGKGTTVTVTLPSV